MARITWLGEDDLHDGADGPQSNEWAGITFKKGEAVSVTDERIITKAMDNRFYLVEDDLPKEKPFVGRQKFSLPNAKA